MVTFKNVSKIFGSTKALIGVSFNVEPGEFVFITGPSGAGKTTVLRLILRDIMSDSGEIIVAGRNIAGIRNGEVSTYRRLVGMVFQDFKLLGDRTIGENVALSLAVRGIAPKEREGKVRTVLDQVGIKDKYDSFPLQLAGGELQRAGLARALVGRPKILLADEPTGNLDPETAWGIIELLDEIREDGTTVIIASHNREIVDKKKGRVIKLKGGKLVKDKNGGKYEED